MNILLIPSSVSPGLGDRLQYLTSYLVNGCVALDAGSLGFYKTPAEQKLVKHVFISHSHIDHLASLPIFIENVYHPDEEPVTVYGSPETCRAIREDLFNDRIWPDMINRLPFFKLETLLPHQTLYLQGLKITPIPVNHAVPTLGFILEDSKSTVIVVQDTGPTEEIWARANEVDNLRAIFLEVSFPDSMTWLADAAKHLTPASFAVEMDKLKAPCEFYAVHLKSAYRDTIIAELEALGRLGLEICRPGTVYEF